MSLALREGAFRGITANDLSAIGVTNQRETVVVWDRTTLEPIHRAIVWQDRRTAEACERLIVAGHDAMVRERTGLGIDPYFSAAKIAWTLDNVDGARELQNLAAHWEALLRSSGLAERIQVFALQPDGIYHRITATGIDPRLSAASRLSKSGRDVIQVFFGRVSEAMYVQGSLLTSGERAGQLIGTVVMRVSAWPAPPRR